MRVLPSCLPLCVFINNLKLKELCLHNLNSTSLKIFNVSFERHWRCIVGGTKYRYWCVWKGSKHQVIPSTQHWVVPHHIHKSLCSCSRPKHTLGVLPVIWNNLQSSVYTNVNTKGPKSMPEWSSFSFGSLIHLFIHIEHLPQKKKHPPLSKDVGLSIFPSSKVCIMVLAHV